MLTWACALAHCLYTQKIRFRWKPWSKFRPLVPLDSCTCMLNPLYTWKPLNKCFCKQWIPRWNAALCCISSESTLFVKIKTIFRQKDAIFYMVFTLCIWETPILILLQTMQTRMKCCISSGSTLFVKVKKILKIIQHFFKIITWHP